MTTQPSAKSDPAWQDLAPAFDAERAAAILDGEALIRNIVTRIEAAEMEASVGYLAGLPTSEAIAHELRALLVDIETQQGFDSADYYATGPGSILKEIESP